jgi:hypothetical protein
MSEVAGRIWHSQTMEWRVGVVGGGMALVRVACILPVYAAAESLLHAHFAWGGLSGGLGGGAGAVIGSRIRLRHFHDLDKSDRRLVLTAVREGTTTDDPGLDAIAADILEYQSQGYRVGLAILLAILAAAIAIPVLAAVRGSVLWLLAGLPLLAAMTPPLIRYNARSPRARLRSLYDSIEAAHAD